MFPIVTTDDAGRDCCQKAHKLRYTTRRRVHQGYPRHVAHLRRPEGQALSATVDKAGKVRYHQPTARSALLSQIPDPRTQFQWSRLEGSCRCGLWSV